MTKITQDVFAKILIPSEAISIQLLRSFGDCFVRPGGLATTVGEKETRVFIRAYSALEKKVRRVRPLVTREGVFAKIFIPSEAISSQLLRSFGDCFPIRCSHTGQVALLAKTVGERRRGF